MPTAWRWKRGGDARGLRARRSGLRVAAGEPLERRDCPATVGVVGPASVTEGDTGFVDATFTVALSGALPQAASVDYSVVAGGGASPGIDYAVPAGTSGRITFAAGETTKSLVVKVRGDTLREPTENFTVRLAAPVNCTLGTAAVTTSILDNDSYTFSIVAPTTTFVEGTSAVVQIRLSSPATRNELVSYRTVNGTARAGIDYQLTSGKVVTFSPGEDTKTITVPTFIDTVTEGPEYFRVLAKPLDPQLGPELGVNVFISETSSPQPVPAVVSVAALVPAANEAGSVPGRFRFTRDTTVAPLTVNYVVTGNATPGSDYSALSGAVTFAAGQAVADVVVTPVNDTAVESPETVIVTLQVNPAYVIGTPTSATVTIASDDTAPPVPPTPPQPQRGFQVTFVLPTGLPVDTVRMFTEAGKQWSAILEDVPEVYDSVGNLLVDDFELTVEFRSSPRSVNDPLYIPWQQPGFGGAKFDINADRRAGAPGLPYRGRAEITTNALLPAFFQKMNPTYDKFSVYKTMELIGRALGFQADFMQQKGLVVWNSYPQLGVTGFIPVVKSTTNAASHFAGKIAQVPLDAPTWPIAHWTDDFARFGGAASFGFDVFVVNWQTRSSMNNETRPKVSNVTRGLFQDLGYGVRYLP